MPSTNIGIYFKQDDMVLYNKNKSRINAAAREAAKEELEKIKSGRK